MKDVCEQEAQVVSDASSFAGSTASVVDPSEGGEVLKEYGAAHGAYFSVNLEKIDGQEVVDFGDNVRLNGYKGTDGNQYQLVTPDEG